MALPPTAALAPVLLFAAALAPQADDSEDAFREVLRADHYFMRARYDVVPDCAPFLLYVQKPGDADPEQHLAETTAMYAPWLAKLGEVFKRDYAVPLDLERQREGPIGVFVLENVRPFRNLQRRALPTGRFAEQVLVLDELNGLIVAYGESFTGSMPPSVKRFPVLHRAVLELLRAYYHGAEERPLERWYVEGLAGHLASHEGEDPAVLDSPMPDPVTLREISELAVNPELRKAQFLPVQELLGPRSLKQILTLYKRRAMDTGTSPPLPETAERLFAGQCAMFMNFLHFGEAGAYRAGTRRYLVKVLSDAGSKEAFLAEIGVDDFARLDHEFQEYLARLASGESIADITRETLAAAALLRPELAVNVKSGEHRLAVALLQARKGDYEGAIESVEIALEAEGEGEGGARARLQRELRRLSALRDARDAYLADMTGSRKKLRVSRAGERIAGTLAAYEDGVLRLAVKDGESVVPVTEISPGDLLENIGKKFGEFGPEWVRCYGRFLAGDPGWAEKLPGGEDGQALAADGQGDFPGLLRLGTATARLDKLAREPIPESAREAQALMDEIADLVLENRGLEPVEGKLKHLRKLAHKLLGVVFDTEGLTARVHGKFKSLDDGRIRLTYEFDDADEALDFERVPGYLGERRADRFPIDETEDESELRVKGGNFEGSGAVCYRLPIPFEAPMTVEYELLYGRPRPGKGMLANFLLGICDDGQGNYVGAFDLFDLEAIHKPTPLVNLAYKTDGRSIEAAKTYKLQLAHDGASKVTLSLKGKQVQEVDCGPIRSGRVFIWVHAEIQVALKRLEIEGRASTENLEHARKGWIEAQLLEAGFTQ